MELITKANGSKPHEECRREDFMEKTMGIMLSRLHTNSINKYHHSNTN